MGIFTLAALAELVTDQLPTTPNRTAPVPFGARIVMGGFSGAAIALAAEQPWLCRCGSRRSRRSNGDVRRLLCADGRREGAERSPFIVATLEDLIAIGVALLIVSRF